MSTAINISAEEQTAELLRYLVNELEFNGVHVIPGAAEKAQAFQVIMDSPIAYEDCEAPAMMLAQRIKDDGVSWVGVNAKKIFTEAGVLMRDETTGICVKRFEYAREVKFVVVLGKPHA